MSSFPSQVLSAFYNPVADSPCIVSRMVIKITRFKRICVVLNPLCVCFSYIFEHAVLFTIQFTVDRELDRPSPLILWSYYTVFSFFLAVVKSSVNRSRVPESGCDWFVAKRTAATSLTTEVHSGYVFVIFGIAIKYSRIATSIRASTHTIQPRHLCSHAEH